MSNAKAKYGETALIWAARNNSYEVEKLLIEKGADVNAKTKGGATALAMAQDKGHSEIVALLKNHGAR